MKLKQTALIIGLFSVSFCAQLTKVHPCPLSLVHCEVTGDSFQGKDRTYHLRCPNLDPQVDYTRGGLNVHLIDPVSRVSSQTCAIRQSEIGILIKQYESRRQEIESPKCYLTQWKGQMTFVAEQVRGRCSFKMNQKKSQAFQLATGVQATYQCENDYFLSAPNNAPPSIYRKTNKGWEFACHAAIQVGERVEDIDWSHPPSYYEPET